MYTAAPEALPQARLTRFAAGLLPARDWLGWLPTAHPCSLLRLAVCSELAATCQRSSSTAGQVKGVAGGH